MIMLHWWRLELPPRARRILRPNTGLTTGNGTTSACAENTPDGAGTPWIPRNYLRVRGEYSTNPRYPRCTPELPPRARRIRRAWGRDVCGGGTTSACAENTPHSLPPHVCCRNYLRVRGEYIGNLIRQLIKLELPPRARRIHLVYRKQFGDHGTTSACAENTGAGTPGLNAPWNYLRVRGEYTETLDQMFESQELPPRARRIHDYGDDDDLLLGTTSACAENTVSTPATLAISGNYLRVRGEYPFRFTAHSDHPELPPRARRIP